jgi:hypothetical protein
LTELVHKREELVADVQQVCRTNIVGPNALHVKRGGLLLAIAEHDEEINGSARVDARREMPGVIADHAVKPLAPRGHDVALAAVRRRDGLGLVRLKPEALGRVPRGVPPVDSVKTEAQSAVGPVRDLDRQGLVGI